MNGKQLKNSILQWAIQGKLVPQDPNDEPASVLLDKIRQEKERLIKEKKIKRDKNASIIYRGEDNSYYEKLLATGEVKCIDEEIPFEIPKGWEWCRMQDFITFVNGRAYKKEELLSKGKYKVLRVGNFFTNNQWYYSDLELPEDKYCYNGDLLYAWSASFGPQIWTGDKTIFHYHIWNVKFDTRALFREYLFYFFLFDKTQVKTSTTGSTMIHVSMENMKPRLIPIPPIDEQKRIVCGIDRVLPYVEKYELSQNKKEILDANLKDSLKKSILQEAIQGKLVPQIAEEGTAQELLEQIKLEKQKLVKDGKLKKSAFNDSVIFRSDDNKYYTVKNKEEVCIDDEIPFDIPNTWGWCYFSDIANSGLGKTMDKGKNSGAFVPYLCSINVYWDKIDLSTIKQAQFSEIEREKYLLRKNDLLICEGGDIGRTAIWENESTMYYQNALHRVRFFGNIQPRYFMYVIALYKALGILESKSKGMTIKHFTKSALNSMVIPLPPIMEQERIVHKIEQLSQLLK